MIGPPELRVLCDDPEHVNRRDRSSAARVVLLHQLPERTSQLALTPQHVLHIQLLQMIIPPKIPHQVLDSQNALKSRIQITRVPQVLKPNLPTLQNVLLGQLDLFMSDFVIFYQFGQLDLLFTDFLALLSVLFMIFLAGSAAEMDGFAHA